MSDQDDPTDRELDQAVELILGPPEGSDSDLLRPIERENLRRYLAGQLGLFAKEGRAATAARIQDAQKRLEDGIAHLPLGHPYREEPEARIAELKAQLADLDAQPIDFSRISIDTGVYRHTGEDLSAAEERAEADPHSADLGTTGQSNGGETGGDAAQETEGPKKSRHKAKKPPRRNEKYEGIDKALREIAAAWPKNHEEVFQLLDDRKVAIPNRKPFKSARGWSKGFQQNRHSATAWLSQVWGRLGLPAFPRGPKK